MYTPASVATDSPHSADVDYAGLLPALFRLNVGRFYIQLASEADRKRILPMIRNLLNPGQMLFVEVIDPINPQIESVETVRDRVLEASELIPLEMLGTTDDCGFSSFADDTSTPRETAFAKIRSRWKEPRWLRKRSVSNWQDESHRKSLRSCSLERCLFLLAA